MSSTREPSVRQIEFEASVSASALCRVLSGEQSASMLLDGAGDFAEPWLQHGLVAVAPRVLDLGAGSSAQRLGRIDDLLRRRRREGGAGETGVLLVLSYEFGRPPRSPSIDGLPDVAALVVDRSVRVKQPGKLLYTDRSREDRNPTHLEREVDRLAERAAAVERLGSPPAPDVARARTSLPRSDYLEAVRRIKKHIVRGDTYQCNLCQRFETDFNGDPIALYRRLSEAAPAPHSAYVSTPDFALASVSPETFLRSASPGAIETWPIKGTRPRGSGDAADRAASRELVTSEKDRAELLMIVDLERNDLSRICRPGTVTVDEFPVLRSFTTVHHLVARVCGTLREGQDLPAMVAATFPGGSITGAPKIRAMQILRELEPVPRDFFTGSLFWFGDDGTMDSSILIRTAVLGSGRAFVGAGGGIVADSDPEAEWLESNHKARALTRALGFEPEEAV